MNIATVAGAGTTSLGGAVLTLADDTDSSANIINSNIIKQKV